MTDRGKGKVRRYRHGAADCDTCMMRGGDAGSILASTSEWIYPADHEEVVAGKDAEIARLEARLESENGCLQLMRDIIKHELGIEAKHFDGVIGSVVKETQALRARVAELEEELRALTPPSQSG